MRTPPLYLACAVLFWAWHAQVLLVGVGLAVLLEAPRIVRTRWRLSPVEFARVADLCTWAFVILAGYLIFARGLPIPVLEIFGWLPLVMVPLVAAQLFSESGRLPLSALFLMLRGKHAGEVDRNIDFTYPYAIVCALAAGAVNVRHDAYYYGLTLLTAWGLWTVRSRRYGGFVWAGMFVCLAALGYGGHLGLSRLQDVVMESTTFSGTRTDPYRSTTDIGQIGELKQSDRIVLRVGTPPGAKLPLLLHRASYNAYASPTWLARDAPFAAVNREPDGSSWVFGDAGALVSRIVVSQPVERGKTVLALPNGTARIERLPVAGLQRNLLGAVQIESREDLVTYQAALDPGAVLRDAPREIDLRVPRQEAAHLDQLVERLQLKGKPAREVLASVKSYFEREFTYSTYLSLPQQRLSTPLADFLLVTRTGHCEYFATATTLLLRAAGVPARYATGYSIQEWSPLENAYIARGRHAHAWVRVRVDDRWVDFDTTPPVWFAAEAQGASLTQPVTDLWSWAAYRYARWQREHPAATTAAALAVVVLLAAVLIWRLIIRKPLSAGRTRKVPVAARRGQPGADSEFYQIESQLVRAGCPRAAHEPLGAWLARIGRERADIAVAPLQALLRLHYQYRFDPQGLDAVERRALAEQAQRWLQAHKKP